MALDNNNIQYSRQIQRRFTGAGLTPTIPANDDFTVTPHLVTDVLEGELIANITDGKVWTRIAGGVIVELTGSSGSGDFLANGSVPMTGDFNADGNDLNKVAEIKDTSGNKFIDVTNRAFHKASGIKTLDLSTGVKIGEAGLEVEIDSSAITTPRLQGLQDKDGVIALAGDVYEFSHPLYGAFTTGFKGALPTCTVNADPAKIDITSCNYQITDYWTTPSSPVTYDGAYAGATAITLTYLATNSQTFIYFDKYSAIFQSNARLDREQERDYVSGFILGHTNNTTVNSILRFSDISESPIEQLYDLFSAIDLINTGNVVSANGANLSINKGVGYLFGKGINSTLKSPHNKTMSAQTLATLRIRTQTGAGSTATVIDPTVYDLAGTLTSIAGSSNQAQNFRLYLFPSGNIVVQNGQQVYSSLNAAIAGYLSEAFIEYQNVSTEAILIAAISVTKGCTDLSDVATAKFHAGSKFKGVPSIGSGGGGVTSFNGRIGAIIPASADYDTLLVTENTNLYHTNARAIGSTLTGFTSGAGTVTSADTVLSALQKIDANSTSILGLNNAFTGVNTFSNVQNNIKSLYILDIDGVTWKQALNARSTPAGRLEIGAGFTDVYAQNLNVGTTITLNSIATSTTGYTFSHATTLGIKSIKSSTINTTGEAHFFKCTSNTAAGFTCSSTATVTGFHFDANIDNSLGTITVTAFRDTGNIVNLAAGGFYRSFYSGLNTGSGTRHQLYLAGSAPVYIASSVGLGTAAPNTSCAIDIVSTTQGFGLPSMTSAQKTAISSPRNGLVIYQSDGTAGVYAYVGGSWVLIS